jgi:type IV secretory pathway TrbL component
MSSESTVAKTGRRMDSSASCMAASDRRGAPGGRETVAAAELNTES